MMKRRYKITVVIVVLITAGVGGYLLFRGDDWIEGDFPELRPAGDTPGGYAWGFHDGPDFYTWVLKDNVMGEKRARSGIGIYFGHHPDLSIAKKAPSRLDGRAFSKKVTWMIETNDDPVDTWIRKDAALRYNHGKGYGTILIHVWVWGQTEEQVAPLIAQVEQMAFVLRQ